MKLIHWFLLIGVLLVMAVAGAVGWLLFTQNGLDWAVAKVNARTSVRAMPIVLGRVSGNVLRDISVESVTVGDRDGVWLTIEGVRVVWHPLALLDGTPPFTLFEVGSVRVARLPVRAPVAAPAPVAPFATADRQMPAAPSGPRINPLDYMIYAPRNVRVGELLVEAPVTGQRHRVSAEVVTVGDVQRVSVSTLEGPATTVSGTVALASLDGGHVAMELNEAPGGLIGGLVKLPSATQIAGQLVADVSASHLLVSKAELKVGKATVRGVADIAVVGKVVNTQVWVDVPELGMLQPVTGVPMKGRLSATATTRGGLGLLGVGLEVSRTDVTVNGMRVASATAVLNGTVDVLTPPRAFVLKGQLGGRLSGVGQGVYPLAVGVDVSGSQVALGGVVSASMVRAGERAQVLVSGSAVVTPLTVIGGIDGVWEQVMKGRKNTFVAKGGVEIDPTRAVLKQVQVTGPGVVVSASGTVDLQRYLGEGNAVVKVVDLAPLGALAGVDVRGGLDAAAVARVSNGVQVGDATVRKMEVHYGDYDVLLKAPARLVWDGTKGSLSNLDVSVAGGEVRAHGSMNAQTVNAVLAVTNVDMAKLSGDMVEGRVGLDATVSGLSKAPVVVAKGTLKGQSGDYPFTADVKGDWRGGKLAVQGSVDSSRAHAAVNATVQGGLSLVPFAVGIDLNSALRGTVDANVPLDMFNTFLWASKQHVEGKVSGNVALGGTLGAPEVNGKFALRDGAYTEGNSGLCLENVSADLVGSRDVVTISDLRAHDDAGGTLTGTGSLKLQGAMPLDAALTLSKLRLFCGGLASGNVDGGLTVKGVLSDHTVAGDLTVGPLNVQIPGGSNETDIPRVETVRVRAGETGEKASMTVTRLAVNVNAPREIYVRGRGLDAEFGGKIAVTGTADNPLLNGGLTAIRGHFTLLDRQLELTDSAVKFEGPIPPSPYLAVKATTTAQGTAITIAIDGTATKPKLTLSSDPSVPQDEALALLLFGRKLANISAFEALKLAQATRVLAGLDGGGPGILDKARETLGVDTLDIGSGEESGDVTVKTGKYLTDKVYLSVEQGTEPEDRQIKTEIELLPSVTGNTTVDGVGNQSFGLEWKRDY